ncbi:MAG: VWA domain-containing protein [Bacteroides sp.]|nr:VWA domain-containing protein [Bacteroides sp.]
MTFAYKPFLMLLGFIPLLVVWYIWKYREHGADLRFSHSEFLVGVKKSLRLRLLQLPFFLRMLVLALLIIALARPQSSSQSQDVSVEGIDIMVALDISGSMLAEDFRPNRLEVAKKTALEFIEMRPTDRLGMSVFSGESFTLCPLTTDHVLLKELTSGVTTGMVEDGTAIGDGLANAINRLRESEAISKVIILLTDGISNAGVIDPLTAAEIASVYGNRVYTIGVGSKGSVPYPFQTPLGVQYRQVEIPLDEALLTQIAEMTGGAYYWADNEQKLQEIYQEIDQLERTRIDVTEFTRKTDEFFLLVIAALFLLLLEIVLRNTWLRTNP